MPWKGKRLDPGAGRGINRFSADASLPVRLLFPGHPQNPAPGGFEAFPFALRTGPGAVDPSLTVVKIDYDFAANPAIIRRILDEVVAVDARTLLGKILLRAGGAYRRIGFFALEAHAS